MYFRYPLETLASTRRAAHRVEFTRSALQAMRDTDDVRFQSMEAGVRILAADEDSLINVAQVLRDLFGDLVEMRAPQARLMPGNPVQEPIMNVRISMRADHGDAVRQELRARDATILEECTRSRVFIIRAEAPLARLLGLPARLNALTDGTAVHWIRLNRYAALSSGPEGRAA